MAAVAGVGVLLTAVVMTLLRVGGPVGTASVWWMLAVAAVTALLAMLLRPTPVSPVPGAGPLDDDAWSARAAALLRLRDLPESRVRDLVAEARSHAHEAGAPMSDALGSPERYAAGFAPDTASRERRRAAALGGLGVAGAILAVDPWSWPWALMAAVLLGAAAVVAARARRRRRRPPRG